MAAPTRASLKVGIGRIVRGSFSTQGENEFALRIIPRHVDITIGGEKIGARKLCDIAELTFLGDGRLTSALISEYNTYASMRVGASCGTDSDVATTIHWNDGSSTTVLRASFFSKLGAIVGHPEKGIVEAHTITGIVATGKQYSESASFVDDAVASSTFADSGFLTSAILRQQWSAAMATGPTGFTAFQFQDGFRFEPNLNIQPLVIQGVIRDFRFQGLEAMLSGIPVEPTFANAMAAMLASGAGAVPGREEAANAFSFTATGDVDSTAHVTIPLCSVIRTQQESSSIKLRLGETGFMASRPYSAGARSALYTIA